MTCLITCTPCPTICTCFFSVNPLSCSKDMPNYRHSLVLPSIHVFLHAPLCPVQKTYLITGTPPPFLQIFILSQAPLCHVLKTCFITCTLVIPSRYDMIHYRHSSVLSSRHINLQSPPVISSIHVS